MRTTRLEKNPTIRDFRLSFTRRGEGEGVPRWISPALIELIRNALGKTKLKTGSRGGVHFVQCTALFLSWERRLCALFTAALRIFGQSWS